MNNLQIDDLQSISSSEDSYITERDIDPDEGCDKCLNPTVFAACCKDCLIYLCEIHVEHHQLNRLKATHSLVEKDDVDVTYSGLDQNRQIVRFVQTCDLHSSTLADLYCVPCKLAVCHKCAFLTVHRGHKFMLAMDQAAIATDTIRRINETNAQQFKYISTQKIDILNSLTNLERLRFAHLIETEREQDSAIQSIKNQFKERLQKYDCDFERERDRLNTEICNHDLSLNLLTGANTKSERVLQSKYPFIIIEHELKGHPHELPSESNWIDKKETFGLELSDHIVLGPTVPNIEVAILKIE